MRARFRHYRPYQDEASVSAFLERTCPPGTQLPNWLRPRWEYMIYAIHDGDQERLRAFGLWDSSRQIQP